MSLSVTIGAILSGKDLTEILQQVLPGNFYGQVTKPIDTFRKNTLKLTRGI